MTNKTRMAQASDSASKNLKAAAELGKEELKKVQDFISKHGLVKLLGTSALVGGGTTALVLGGQRILSPEQEAAVIITEDGELLPVDQDPAPNDSNPVLGAGLISAAGLAAMMAEDDREQYEADLERLAMTDDPYTRRPRTY